MITEGFSWILVLIVQTSHVSKVPPFILLSSQGPHSFESVWKVHSESIKAVLVLFFFPQNELQKVNCHDTPFAHVETERLFTIHRLWWQVWGHTNIHPSCCSGDISNIPACRRHVPLSINGKQKNLEAISRWGIKLLKHHELPSCISKYPKKWFVLFAHFFFCLFLWFLLSFPETRTISLLWINTRYLKSTVMEK